MCGSKAHSQGFVSLKSPPSSIKEEKEKSCNFLFPGFLITDVESKLQWKIAGLCGDYTDKALKRHCCLPPASHGCSPTQGKKRWWQGVEQCTVTFTSSRSLSTELVLPGKHSPVPPTPLPPQCIPVGELTLDRISPPPALATSQLSHVAWSLGWLWKQWDKSGVSRRRLMLSQQVFTEN